MQNVHLRVGNGVTNGDDGPHSIQPPGRDVLGSDFHAGHVAGNFRGPVQIQHDAAGGGGIEKRAHQFNGQGFAGQRPCFQMGQGVAQIGANVQHGTQQRGHGNQPSHSSTPQQQYQGFGVHANGLWHDEQRDAATQRPKDFKNGIDEIQRCF